MKDEKKIIKMKGIYKIVFGFGIVLILIIPLPVVADLGDIVASFNTPPGGVSHLNWDGEYLWCYGTKMYKMDTNGNIITSSDYPESLKRVFFWGNPLTGGKYFHAALTSDGKYFYAVTNNYTSSFTDDILEFYKFDTKGNIITSSKHVEHIQHRGSPFLSSLTYDGKHLWGIGRNPYIWNTYKLYTFDTDGNLISSLDTDVHFERDDAVSSLAWGGEYFWCTNPCEGRIYKLDTKGNAVTSIDAPCKHSRTKYPGLTCDGKYLWCAVTCYETGTEDNKIYKIDLGKAVPSSKPSEEESTQPLKQPEKGIPGFEILFAIAGLLAVTYLLRRRK